MNKSLLAGLLGGVSLATAGGVAGFVMLNEPAGIDETQATMAPEPAPAVEHQPQAEAVSARSSTPSSPQPRAAVPAPSPAPSAPAEEQCWDEEVTVQAEPKDEHAIAGTAAGAVLGGALAKKIGDDNDLLTVAGAVGGAFAGRKLQQRMQENNTTTQVERRCEPAQPQ